MEMEVAGTVGIAIESSKEGRGVIIWQSPESAWIANKVEMHTSNWIVGYDLSTDILHIFLYFRMLWIKI